MSAPAIGPEKGSSQGFAPVADGQEPAVTTAEPSGAWPPGPWIANQGWVEDAGNRALLHACPLTPQQGGSRRAVANLAAAGPEMFEALTEAVMLLARCERRLEHHEGLNRSGLRLHLQEFWRANTAGKALAKALGNADPAAGRGDAPGMNPPSDDPQ